MRVSCAEHYLIAAVQAYITMSQILAICAGSEISRAWLTVDIIVWQRFEIEVHVATCTNIWIARVACEA